MTREKKTRMVYTVELLVEGYGEINRFQEVADKHLKQLHLDVTSAHVDRGCATVCIKKPSKIISRVVL